MITIAAYRKFLLRLFVRGWAFVAVLFVLAGAQPSTFAQSCGYYVQTKHERQSAQLRNTGLNAAVLNAAVLNAAVLNAAVLNAPVLNAAVLNAAVNTQALLNMQEAAPSRIAHASHRPASHRPASHRPASHRLSAHGLRLEMNYSESTTPPSASTPMSDRKRQQCDGPGCRQQPTAPPVSLQAPVPETSSFQMHGILSLSDSAIHLSANNQSSSEESLHKATSVSRGLFRPPRKHFSLNA